MSLSLSPHLSVIWNSFSLGFFLFFLCVCDWGGETDSKSERGGRQSDTLNAEGGEIRQEQVFFFFFLSILTRGRFLMRRLERTGSAYRKQVAQIPRASGDEIDPPQPSSRLRRGRCYSHTSHHHLLKRESSSFFHQVKLHTLEKCCTANVLRFFFFPQWY